MTWVESFVTSESTVFQILPSLLERHKHSIPTVLFLPILIFNP